MTRAWMLGAAAVLVVGSIGAGMFVATSSPPAAQATAVQSRSDTADARGTSVTVLVDFSRSFIPVATSGKSAGLTETDESALQMVAGELERLSWETWPPPIKILWSPITAGDLVQPLCEPIFVDPTVLVSRPPVVARPEDIKAALQGCLARVVNASRDPKRLAGYTDIAAAIASAESAGEYAERLIVVLSDLKQDLKPGNTAAALDVAGARMLLLHRQGTDGRDDVRTYLSRIAAWKTTLEASRAAVTAVPLLAASRHRTRVALDRQARVGTSLTVLVDRKRHVLTAVNGSSGEPVGLQRLADSLAMLSAQWPAPVTAQWIGTGTGAFQMRAEPPVDMDVTLLIPKPGEINKPGEFAMFMRELVYGVSAGSVATSDLAGAAALATAVEPSPARHVVAIVSDFAPAPPASAALAFAGDTRVVLMHTPSGEGRDVNAEQARRDAWSAFLTRAGAQHVCQIRLATWTPDELGHCLEPADGTPSR
jgi:hypothetical protein